MIWGSNGGLRSVARNRKQRIEKHEQQSLAEKNSQKTVSSKQHVFGSCIKLVRSGIRVILPCRGELSKVETSL